jgi:hypothetical protein
VKRDPVAVFIGALREYVPDAPLRFTSGACFGLYRLIRAFHPDARAWYDPIAGHVYTEVDGRFYDIEGRRPLPAAAVPLSEHKPRLARAWRWRFAATGERLLGAEKGRGVMGQAAIEVRRTERRVGRDAMAALPLLGIAMLAWANWWGTRDGWALLGATAFTVLGLLYAFTWWLGVTCLRDHDCGLIDLEDMRWSEGYERDEQGRR